MRQGRMHQLTPVGSGIGKGAFLFPLACEVRPAMCNALIGLATRTAMALNASDFCHDCKYHKEQVLWYFRGRLS